MIWLLLDASGDGDALDIESAAADQQFTLVDAPTFEAAKKAVLDHLNPELVVLSEEEAMGTEKVGDVYLLLANRVTPQGLISDRSVETPGSGTWLPSLLAEEMKATALRYNQLVREAEALNLFVSAAVGSDRMLRGTVVQPKKTDLSEENRLRVSWKDR